MELATAVENGFTTPPALPFHLLVATVSWLAVFQIHRAAAMDPHNPRAVAGNLACSVKATAILFAALATGFTTPTETGRDIAAFLGMFALAHTAAVPFVSRDRFTPDEVPSRLQRHLFGLRISMAGGLMLKVAVILLAFALPDSLGLYVVYPVIAVGGCLVLGKVFLAALLSEGRVPTPNSIWAFLAYAYGSATVVVVLEANGVVVDPANWMGWSGFLIGAVFARP